MSDRELIADLDRRCRILLERNEVSHLTLDNISIRLQGGRLSVDVLGQVLKLGLDTYRSSENVFDSNAPTAEQCIGDIRGLVMPVLQRHMVLEDLSDV